MNPEKLAATMIDNAVYVDERNELRSAPDDQWQARRELAEQMRAITLAMLTTDVPAADLRALAARMQGALAVFENRERIIGRAAHRDRYMRQHGVKPDLLYELSPAMGFSNPVAMPMHTWSENGRTHAEVTPDWVFEGPLEHLHGGVIASLFDQVLGTTQHLTGGGGMTGTLSIRYLKPVPLNKKLHFVAEVKRTDDRKRFILGELWVEDILCATSEGVFIAPRELKPQAGIGNSA